MSERKTFTSKTSDKFGAHAEIEKHRAEAVKLWKWPEHIGTSSSSEPAQNKPGEHVYTISSTWAEGTEPPKPAEPEA